MPERGPKPSRIAIGIDFSASSLAAAQWAALWMPKDAELVLVHSLVVPQVTGSLAQRLPLPPSLIANAKAGAERRLKELAASLGSRRFSVEIREGRPADVIAQVARDTGADLIIVGKHGEAGIQRGYTGRTTDHLVRTSPAAVLMASAITDDVPRRIIVPLTYSSITPYIIEWTKRVYDLSQADIFAVHVIGSAVLSHVLTMSAIKSGKDLSPEEIDVLFGEDRDRWKKELVKAGIPADKVSAEVVFGEVSDAIITAVQQHKADMVVMGSHAGPLRRLLLGSATSAVLRQAEVPVLIVIEPEPTQAGVIESYESEELLTGSLAWQEALS